MRDHHQIFGTLLLVWGVLQGIAAAVFGATQAPPGTGAGTAAIYVLIAVLVTAAYVWTGLRLRAHDSRARVPGIILAVLMLLSFPIGTALGAYGLWALIPRRTHAQAH